MTPPPKKRGGKILSFFFGFLLGAIIFANHGAIPNASQPVTATNQNPTAPVVEQANPEPQVAGIKVDAPTSTPDLQPQPSSEAVDQANVQPTPAADPQPEAIAPNGTYTNVDGNEVPRPYAAPSVPAGASARCGDGTYSFSQHRSGTCSHHGGVAEWY